MSDEHGAPPQAGAREPRGDLALYALAAALLIGLGILLTTPVLNWIAGPALVVAVVTLTPRLGTWWKRGRRR